MAETQTFTIRDFRLENGEVLPEARIAYETYGTLAADGRNAVLLTHGYTSSHKAASGGSGVDADAAGWWEDLVGPGKAIDTSRVFAVSSNMLGSSYGSTNAASIDPRTGKPYGPDFPEITLLDMVRAQRALLDALQVRHLIAVAGPSFGGYQAFQWAVTYPDFMHGIVAAVTAPKGRGGEDAVDQLIAQLAADPNWNAGRYYETGGILPTMTAMRVETLRNYGIEEQLAPHFPDPAAREREIRRIAEAWARNHDPHSLVILRRAATRFDAERDFDKIQARVLYVLSSTDNLFPPSIAPAVMAKLQAAGVNATYFQLESPYGHLASGKDAAKWSPVLKRFMDELIRADAGGPVPHVR